MLRSTSYFARYPMKFLFSAALLLGALFIPIHAAAAPTCVSQTLSDYIALPDGCSIDGLVFSGFRYFSSAIFGNPELVPADEVTVNPIIQPRPGLSFSGNWTATASIADHLIFYEVSTLSGLPTISDGYLDWSFNRTGPFSVASLDEFLCLDGSPVPGGCGGNPPLRFYLRSSIAPGNPSDHISFAPVAKVVALEGRGSKGYLCRRIDRFSNDLESR